MSRDLQQRISALRSVEQRVQPDEAWVKATRETLMMQVRNSLPTEPVRVASQLRQVVHYFFPRQLIQFMRGPLVATLSILVVAFGGSVASVSAAEQSLPGDFLYSLKLATEQARLALTPAKDEKLKLKIEFTTRRADELKNVAKTDGPDKPERVTQAAEILKRDLNTVKQQLEDVKNDSEPKKAVEVARLVDQKSNELVQSLQESKSDLSVEGKEKVMEAQAAAADTSVKAIEVLAEKHQQSNSDVGENEVVQAIQDHTKTVADVTPASATAFIASSTASLANVTGTSLGSLTQAVEQMKTATQSAFAVQKTADQIAASSSSTIATIPSDTATVTSTAEMSSSTSPSAPSNAGTTPP